MKWYVGFTREDKLEAFKAPRVPTFKTHGKPYWVVLGPFVTRRGARWAQKYARNNPQGTPYMLQ